MNVEPYDLVVLGAGPAGEKGVLADCGRSVEGSHFHRRPPPAPAGSRVLLQVALQA